MISPEDFERVQALEAELTALMTKYQTDAARRSGPYSDIGQAKYRVGDGVNKFLTAVGARSRYTETQG